MYIWGFAAGNFFLSCSFRKNQELWQALENKVRQDLINRSLEKIPLLNKRKDR